MRESPAKCVRVGRSAGTSSMPAGHCMVTKRIQSPTRLVEMAYWPSTSPPSQLSLL